MNQTQLDKLLGLIRRTGDRAVIADNETDNLFVMMDSDNYERLISHTRSVRGLSEAEMMEKINRDIALWRSHNQSEELNWYDEGEDYGFEDNEDDNFTNDFVEDKPVDYNEGDELSENNKEDLEDQLFEEEIPFDELERDGFVVEGEKQSAKINENEPLYFEHDGSQPAIDSVVPEVTLEEKRSDLSNRFEGGAVNGGVMGGGMHVEESLDDVVEDNDELAEEDKFLVEPI